MDPVMDRLQAYVGARLNTTAADGIFVLNERGFPRQGGQSVGVVRQYYGILDKVGTCQVGVFLAYVSASGHALVDKELYLPPAWIADPTRWRAASAPAEIGDQRKAE